MIATIAILVALLTAQPVLMPAPESTQAFDRYVALAEARTLQEESSIGSFLALPSHSPGRSEPRLRNDEIAIDAVRPATQIPGGLIHDWIGMVVVPHASVAQILHVVQDFDHLNRYYAPTVVSSRLISRHGDDFHILLRTQEHKVITVVLDSEYDVHYGRLDASHQYSFSRSTRVTEIDDARGPHEHPVKPADNHGYLWRLNSYWRFSQDGDGVVVECEAISLTRDIPKGLGWLIGPYLNDIPRESLRSMLVDTRDAVETVSH